MGLDRPKTRTALALAVALMATTALPGESLPPRKMVPTPPGKLRDIGTAAGMARYSSKPVPGYPGMDPDVPGHEPCNTPMSLPCKGSVEQHSRNAGYHPKTLPYNHRTLIRDFRAVDPPGVPARAKEPFAQVEVWLKPGAGWWCDYVPTGKRFAPEPVVRLKPAGTRLRGRLRAEWSRGPWQARRLRILGDPTPQIAADPAG